MTSRRHSDAAKLGDVLQRYLAKRNAREVASEHMIPAIWPEVVGPWYARHCHVVRVWEGIVEVQCDSAARAQQLQLDSAEVIRRLNQRLGQQYVHQVRPSTAGRPARRTAVPGLRPPEPLPAPTDADLEAIELSEEQRCRLEACARRIDDPAAREAFERAARTHLKLRAWKLAHGWVPCPRCGELCPPAMGCIYCRTHA